MSKTKASVGLALSGGPEAGPVPAFLLAPGACGILASWLHQSAPSSHGCLPGCAFLLLRTLSIG